jgi:hypothetical protein
MTYNKTDLKIVGRARVDIFLASAPRAGREQARTVEDLTLMFEGAYPTKRSQDN